MLTGSGDFIAADAECLTMLSNSTAVKTLPVKPNLTASVQNFQARLFPLEEKASESHMCSKAY
jgi:hypothetical protein